MGSSFAYVVNIWQQQIDDDAQGEIFISMRVDTDNEVDSATFLLNDCISSSSGCTTVQINNQLISGQAAFTSDIDNDGTAEVLMINNEFFSTRSTVQMLDYVGSGLINLGQSQHVIESVSI